MADFDPRRFYKQAVVEAEGGFYRIVLDGRGAKTPARSDLVVPSEPLAREIAAEWNAQGDVVSPLTMPLTRLAATAIDRIGPHRDDIFNIMVNFAATDLLCYRAESPEDLVKQQFDIWQPLLDWAAQTYGAHMAVTNGVVPIPQSKEALAALRDAIEGFDEFALSAASSIAAATASLILALALTAGHIDARAAFAASQLDESYQIERWGEDSEALERRDRIRADIDAAAQFLRLLQ